MAIFSPMTRLSRVDLPALGRPISATTPDLRCSSFTGFQYQKRVSLTQRRIVQGCDAFFLVGLRRMSGDLLVICSWRFYSPVARDSASSGAGSRSEERR